MLTLLKNDDAVVKPRLPPGKKRMAALLVRFWEGELELVRLVEWAIFSCKDVAIVSRLFVHGAVCRAAATRCQHRTTALGVPFRPVARISKLPDDLPSVLWLVAWAAEAARDRSSELADLSRKEGDLSTAWVGDLNRIEKDDMVREIRKMLEGLA